jgi:hypothetical protein
MAQRGAGKQDQWRGYMTVLVVNHGIIKSISILTAGILPVIKFDVAQQRDCFVGKLSGRWPFISGFQHSALDLDLVHHLPHSLLQETDTYCLTEGSQ